MRRQNDTTIVRGVSETKMPRTPWDGKNGNRNKARKMKMIKIVICGTQDKQYRGKLSL